MNNTLSKKFYFLCMICVALGCLGLILSVFGIVPGLFAVIMGHYLFKKKKYVNVSGRKVFSLIGLIVGYLACALSLRCLVILLINIISYGGDIGTLKRDNNDLMMRNIWYSLDAYKKDKGKYPAKLTDLTDGEKKYFVPRIPNDVWNTPYHYVLQENIFTISSAGKDKKFGTDDDIIYTSNDKVECPYTVGKSSQVKYQRNP